MRSRGFTLIELVITIMIVAIIAASLVGILRSTVDSKIVVESEIRARKLGPGIMSTISRDLRNTFAVGKHDDVQIDGSYFLGEAQGDDDRAQDWVVFTTTVDSYMRYEGIRSDITEVGYYVEENEEEEGLYILYRREDFAVDKRPDEGGKAVKLHDRVVSFKIRYYELPEEAIDEEGNIDPEQLKEIVVKGGSTEVERWDSKEEEAIPYAVRVELVIDATPTDAYNRGKKKRYAFYETLVRLPDLPKLEEKFWLYDVQAPTAATNNTNGNNNGANNGSGDNGNGTTPPPGGDGN